MTCHAEKEFKAEDTRGHSDRLLRCQEKHLYKKQSALKTLLLPAHFHRDNQVVYPCLLCNYTCVCVPQHSRPT